MMFILIIVVNTTHSTCYCTTLLKYDWSKQSSTQLSINIQVTYSLNCNDAIHRANNKLNEVTVLDLTNLFVETHHAVNMLNIEVLLYTFHIT